MVPLHFSLGGSGDAYSVSLRAGGETAVAPFLFDLGETSRITKVILAFNQGVAEFDGVREVGTLLFQGLLQQGVRDLFERTRDAVDSAGVGAAGAQCVIRLTVPAGLQSLPWECLYDEQRRGFLLNHAEYLLVRESVGVPVPPVQVHGLPLRVLVVVPEGSRLQVQDELHSLKLAIGKLDEDIDLVELVGHVTPDILREKIEERVWDIVHFIGHGEVVSGVPHIRLNDEAQGTDLWMADEVFASLFDRSSPRLVVLNCCLGGRQSTTRTMSGLGPSLLRAGVPAVVAMQFEIPDHVAIKFAEGFYEELLSGPTPGRIDLALTAARRILYQNQRRDTVLGFVTPVLYLAEGYSTLFERQERTSPPPPSPPPPPVPRPEFELPAELVEAFRDRRCVVVVGSDVLNIGGTRGPGGGPPRPRDLALRLAEEAKCRDLVPEESAAFRPTDDDVLSRVCQLFESRAKRWKLLLAVQKEYRDVQPTPTAEAIASWNLPGLVCMYFDGLIKAAMTRQGRALRSVTDPEQSLPGFQDETLLVHLRGIYADAESLVLTERDQEALYDRIGRMSSEIADVLARRRLGLSLLYIGVSPDDRIVRRLTSVLRGSRNRPAASAPFYFAYRDRDASNEAYWDDYGVQWLPCNTDQLIAAISEALGTPAKT